MTTTTQRRSGIRDTLITAAWFGLATGLIEGLLLRELRRLVWLDGTFFYLGTSIEILWISALFDLLLFGLVGLVLCVAARRYPRLPLPATAVTLFAWLTFFDWLAIPLVGRMTIWVLPVPAAGLAVQFGRWFDRRQERMLRFWRRSLPWLGALALLALAWTRGWSWLGERLADARLPAPDPGTPNVLVIVVDTLRADHLSSYGYARSTSPNVDRIAGQGVLFENAFATSSWTKPSHASLVTGRYTYEHQADADEPLDGRYPTIGEALQARGYRTGAFSANYWTFNQIEGFGRGFHRFEDDYHSLGAAVTHTVYGRIFEDYVLHRVFGLQYRIDRKRADDVNHAVLQWIDQEHGHPFLAFLNYYDVHAPYIPPQPYRSAFSPLAHPGGMISTDWDMDHIYLSLTAEQVQGEIDAYDGAIAYVDDQIGRLLAAIQKRGLGENTLLVVTSDHGELFGEHGLFEHTNSLYRNVIHVPLIWWWPGHIPAGMRVSTPVTNAGLPATVLDLLSQGEEADFPGPSLAQLWQQPPAGLVWPDLLAEVAQIPWVPEEHLTAHGAMRAVIGPRWHYLTHEQYGEELYDWSVDPEETRSLADTPDGQRAIEQFRAYLGQRTSGAADPPG